MALKMLTALDMNGAQILNFLVQVLAADPGSPAEGQFWYNSTAKTLKYYDGTAVVTLGAAGGGGDADTLDGNDSTFYLARTNHTGTQLAATISDLAATVKAYRLDEFAVPAADVAMGSQKVTGLANGTVSNDAVNKGQLDGAVSGLASTTYVDTSIAGLVDSAPGVLDTLNELAAALGDDPNFATTINTALAQRAQRYAATIGDGAATSIAVTHNLNSRDVIVQGREVATPYAQVLCDVEHTSVNQVTLKFNAAPASNALRVMILGMTD